MSSDRATPFSLEALAKVDGFMAEHGRLTRQGVEQPGQGTTNRVIFVRGQDGLVVFKVFCEAERKDRECFALRHWRATGLVPELIWDVDATMIAMSHVPGIWLATAREQEGQAAWGQACRETGQAVGSLTRVPLSAAGQADFESHFYEGSRSLESYLGRIIGLGRGVHARDGDFRDGFWQRSLDFVEAELDGILSQPRVLYHQDVGNLHVQRGRFMGFFDLEMCRVGCAAMQLGSSLDMLEGYPEGWGLFRDGWETATGGPLTPADCRAAAAARQLLGWREITRYLSYDGTPGTGYSWASPADPASYRNSFQAVENLLHTGAF